jgi:hypothetical protein
MCQHFCFYVYLYLTDVTKENVDVLSGLVHNEKLCKSFFLLLFVSSHNVSSQTGHQEVILKKIHK